MPRPSPYWGSEPYWYDPAITNHAAMDRKGRVWMSSRFGGPRISRRSVATIHPLRSRLKSRAFGRCSTTTPRRSRFIRSTSASTRTTCSSRTTRTRRSTATACSAAPSAGSTRESSTRPATRPPRKVGVCRTTTLTATARSRQVSTATFAHLGQPSGQLAGMRIPAGVLYSVIAHPTDGTVWGAVPGRCRDASSGRSQDLRLRGLRAAVQQSRGQRQRLHAARHRRRYLRRDLDGARRQRPSRELRSPQVQSLSGARRDDAQHCPEVDAGIARRGRASRARRMRFPSTCTITTSSTSSTRSALERTARERHELRLAARVAARRPLGRAARAVSARILLARHGRPHRRSERRLEGPRALCRLRPERGLAHRGRRGTRSSLIKFQLRPDPLASNRMSLRSPCAARIAAACCASPRSAPRTRSAISRAIGANGSTRICQERGAGPEIGDYTGLPINDAARLRADSWDAAKWTMPERQCEPHPADYGPRGPAALLRIGSTVDPISQDVISWDITVMWMLPHRTIYYGRPPHPSPNASTAGRDSRRASGKETCSR